MKLIENVELFKEIKKKKSFLKDFQQKKNKIWKQQESLFQIQIPIKN